MSIRIRSLRKQIALVHEIIEQAQDMNSDDAARWAYALIPLTDDLLKELRHEESGVPYVRAEATMPPGGTDLFWVDVHTSLPEVWRE